MSLQIIRTPLAGQNWETTVKHHLACVAALVMAAAASAAAAQTSGPSTQDIIVRSTLSTRCWTTSTPLAATGTLNLGALTGVDGRLVSSFAGAATTDLTAAGEEFICNGAVFVSLKAEPLVEDAAAIVSDTMSFSNRVDYDARLSWGGQTFSTGSDDATPLDRVVTGGAHKGALSIAVSDPRIDGGKRPIAGDYVGAVILSIATN